MSETAKKRARFPLHSIYFYPTESCNLRCIHCWIQPSHASGLQSFKRQNADNVSVEVMERVVRDALPMGLGHVKLTGGEPFLNPRIFDYMEVFARHELQLSIETNGTLLTGAAVERLTTVPLRFISTSLDGSCPENHDAIRGVKGGFKRTLRGIRLLIERKIFPQVIFCLHRLNAFDLEPTIRLASELGVKSFEINPLSLLGEDHHHRQTCQPLSIEKLLELERWVENDLCQQYPDMNIDLYLPPALKGIKELVRHSIGTCSLFNICGILANGDVSLCGIGKRKQQLVVGNVQRESITRLWEEGWLFRKVREAVPHRLQGVCGRCLFKYQCLGFCRADGVEDELSLLMPYSLCDQAYEAGLFPASRMLTEEEFDKVHTRMGS